MQYKIVERSDSRDLSEDVNKLIQLGWQPLGGVSATGGFSSSWYSQAMILQTPTPQGR